ncbi:DUF5134 domain-containing protein [Streptomyces fructofermentans]|uniref:DUF5134 domain-containing protein n=1 Tax=Streptomyces fructofermentans TaxID=152141 RepID=UPI001E655AF8|nr:DUF5134 domain-containing protein [Streptomyces fructofermentans]
MDTAVLVPRCLLTVLFAAVAAHGLWRGRRSADRGWRGRVDGFLHAVMAVAMAAMPWGRDWDWGREWSRGLPVVAMTVLFGAAALWFPLIAIVRRNDRGTALVDRLPHTVGMAAMVWMLQAPHAGGEREHVNLADGSSPAHHAATGPAVTALLAMLLLGCALRSLTRSMPPLWAVAAGTGAGAAAEPYRQAGEGAMALGAAVMLVMPH